MDHLISGLLRVFKAHYDVINAEGLGVGAAETGLEHLADRVRTHGWMRSALQLAVSSDWNPLDKIRDRVPEGWQCNKLSVPPTIPRRP